MPRLLPHLVKSSIRLVRQSTTVPNTSNTSAFTFEVSNMFFSNPSGMVRGIRRGISRSGFDATRSPGKTRFSIQIEFIELTMFGSDVANGAGHRAHDDGFGLDHAFAELDAGKQRSGGDAGCGKQAVASCHVLDLVNRARVGDAHL